MHPQSLQTSKHWYDHVLPLIRRNQITQGGPIILMQIENEIDFTNVPEAEQKEYIRFLAHLAWNAGIEVPLISNVSSVVRDRTDPDMARILDACDFYPRWSFLVDRELPTSTAGLTMEEKVGLSDRAVLASLRKMHRDEPNSPLSVAELGTGYYSKFGGKLSEDEEGTDALQTNALTKTIIENGVTYLNYYLGWGGTNFDWAAKGVIHHLRLCRADSRVGRVVGQVLYGPRHRRVSATVRQTDRPLTPRRKQLPLFTSRRACWDAR